MKRGVYIGDNPALKGETAVLRIQDDHCLAQFDNLRLKRQYTHNWVRLNLNDFILDKEEPLG